MITHDALARHCLEICKQFELTDQDRVLLFASLSFDVALEQMLPPLLVGATVVLRGDAVWLPEELPWVVGKYGLTVVNLPSAYWHRVAQMAGEGMKTEANTLRLMIVGGEQMLPEGIRLWQQTVGHTVRLLNAYGPTEATITATTCDLTAESLEHMTHVPIGRPLNGRTAYILDRAWQPVPVGVPGELCLGGPLLARGYLNQPDLTAARFIPDPFGSALGARLYRTGDIARFASDGRIEFLGRSDRQVKIRGYRIELEEIESVLAEHPGVAEAVVLVSRQESLLAYVVPRPGSHCTAEQVRAYLAQRVADYMVPSAYRFLASLPVTATGKLDRQALQHMEAQGAESLPVTRPAMTEIEQAIAAIWSELLQVRPVGSADNFFDLGGHSLLATQVISRLRQAYGVELPLHVIFEAPTVTALAAAIVEAVAGRLQEDEFSSIWSELEQMSEDQARSQLNAAAARRDFR
jgi:acyl-coenzyme A synthetase/AMP-(fatty) acid ligase/acyl carrier protein